MLGSLLGSLAQSLLTGGGVINQGSGLNLNLRHSVLHELGVKIISLKSSQVCSLSFQHCVAV